MSLVCVCVVCMHGQNYDDGTCCIHTNVETIHDDVFHQKPASEPASKNFTEVLHDSAFVFLICHCFVSENNFFILQIELSLC